MVADPLADLSEAERRVAHLAVRRLTRLHALRAGYAETLNDGGLRLLSRAEFSGFLTLHDLGLDDVARRALGRAS